MNCGVDRLASVPATEQLHGPNFRNIQLPQVAPGDKTRSLDAEVTAERLMDMDRWNSVQCTRDGTYSEHGMPFGQSTNDVCGADLNGLYEAHVGSLTHLLTAEDDFDPRFDYSFESGLYITTSRCDGAATTTSNDGAYQGNNLSAEMEGCASGVQIGSSNKETNSISDGLEYLSVLNEQLGLNHAKAGTGGADKESVESCGANGQQFGNLQANEETENSQQISDDEQPYISINDAVIADVEHNTEIATRAIEDDITEEDIEIFKHNESVEAAAISLSQGGGESLHVPRIDMHFETHEHEP